MARVIVEIAGFIRTEDSIRATNRFRARTGPSKANHSTQRTRRRRARRIIAFV